MKSNLRFKKAILFVVALFLMCAFASAGVFASEVTTHSPEEIINYLKNSGTTTGYRHSFATEPVKNSIPGNLSDESKQAALKMLNNIRYVAGLNSVTLDETFGQKAQAAAFVDWVIGKLTHYPNKDGDNDVSKPEGMSDEVWNLGIAGAGSSNLAWNQATLNAAVLAWTEDDDAGNIPMIGHRRWTINPGMGKTGFGAAGPYYAEYSFDNSGTGTQTNVKWPARYMPVQYFGGNIPWSISTGSAETQEDIDIVLERTSDSPSGSKTWQFDGAADYTPGNTGTYFNVNNEGYGQTGCIIFRPEGVSEYKNGDKFNVTITGASQGTISYSVEFFNAYPVESIGFENETYRLTGESMNLSPTVTPVEAEGYEVSYSSSDESVATVDNTGTVTKVGIGTTTITATVTGQYTADGNAVTATCTVKVPKPLKGGDVHFWYEGSVEYTGEKATPVYHISDGDKELIEGVDYTVEVIPGDAGIEPGGHFANAFGIGDYYGGIHGDTSYASYTILKRTITADMITLDPAEIPYDGELHKPAVTVKNHNTVLTEDVDYTLTNEGGTAEGSYPVAVTAVDGSKYYTGNATVYFVINAKPAKQLTGDMVTDIEPVTYNGQDQTPEPLVKDGDTVLSKGTDYTLSYRNNKDAGEATVVVSGKGAYGGSVEKTFTINAKALTDEMVTVSGSLTYNGQSQSPDVTVKDGDTSLVANKDYTLENAEATNAGTHNFSVKGKGNYTGTVSKSFTITQKPISADDITVDPIPDQEVNATPDVTVTYGEKVLVKDTDYELSYSGNNQEGTATVTISGIGNFSSSRNKSFQIVSHKRIMEEEVEQAIAGAQYALVAAGQAAAEAQTAADTAAASLAAANQAAQTPGQAAVTAAEKAAADANTAAEKAATAKQKAEAAATAAATAKRKAVALFEAYGAEEQSLVTAAEGKVTAAGTAVDRASDLETAAAQAKTDAGKAVDKAKADKAAADKAAADKAAAEQAAAAAAAAEARARSVVTVTVNVPTVNAGAIDQAIRQAGGSKAYVTKIVLGARVKKISKNTFKVYPKVTVLELKTKKLSKNSIKGSLKGSAVKRAQVKVGNKKTNKKFIKKYKKIFTKKIAGKKVSVK